MRILSTFATLVLLNTALFAAEEPSLDNSGSNPNPQGGMPPKPPATAVAKPGYTPPDLQPPVLYTYPGFVFQRNGEWVGSDYLYNLQGDIGLALDIFYPENVTVDVSQQKLLDLAVNTFKVNRLTARVNPPPGSGSLPFFYIQVMVFPTEIGNVATVAGSLFEEVTLKRIPTQTGAAIQAITWEKQTMFMCTKDDCLANLAKTVEEIAGTFGERWRLFDQMKSQLSDYETSPSTSTTTKPRELRRKSSKE